MDIDHPDYASAAQLIENAMIRNPRLADPHMQTLLEDLLHTAPSLQALTESILWRRRVRTGLQ